MSVADVSADVSVDEVGDRVAGEREVACLWRDHWSQVRHLGGAGEGG